MPIMSRWRRRTTVAAALARWRMGMQSPRRSSDRAAISLVIRTALEDRMLHAEMPGYQEYAQQVRYRLVPGVL